VSGGGVSSVVVVETSAGEQYRCKRVILALPPNQAGDCSLSLSLSHSLCLSLTQCRTKGCASGAAAQGVTVEVAQSLF